MREGTPDVALDWSGSGQWGFSLGAQKGRALRQKPTTLPNSVLVVVSCDP